MITLSIPLYFDRRTGPALFYMKLISKKSRKRSYTEARQTWTIRA